MVKFIRGSIAKYTAGWFKFQMVIWVRF